MNRLQACFAVKKFLVLSLMMMAAAFSAIGQITITQSDMPQPNDVFITTTADYSLSIDPEESGANHNWNFQNLTPAFSTTDTFSTQSGLPLVYQLFFFGANLADQIGYSVSIDQFSLEDVYLVYKNSAASFEQYGYAGTFEGIPVPVVYNSKDVIYHFPLQFGNADSSNSDFTFDLPGFFFISQNRKRVNVVDGWGTITTPVGTFNTLRVKSVITDEDSIYLDTLNYGTNVPVTSYEYKWLAASSGIPVFQINAQDVLGTPVITQVLYQDTVFQTAIENISAESELETWPNPAASQLSISDKDSYEMKSFFITNISGNIVYMDHMTSNALVDVSGWPAGIYFLQLIDKGIVHHHKLVIHH